MTALTPYAGLTSAGVQLVKTANYVMTNAGNPNGLVAGQSGSASSAPDQIWDYQHSVLYVCTVTGTAATAVWSPFNYVASPSITGNLTVSGNATIAGVGNFAGITNTGTLAQSGGANFGTLVGTSATLTNLTVPGTFTNSGTASKFLINSGTTGSLDNVVIGGTTPAAGTFTGLALSGTSGTLSVPGSASVVNFGNSLSVGGAATFTGAITPNATAGIVGETSGSAAGSGYVGQVLSATGTSVSLTTGTIANITSLVVPAGDFDISMGGQITCSGTISSGELGFGTASTTMPSPTSGQLAFVVTGPVNAGEIVLSAGPIQSNVTSSTTWFLCAASAFSTGAATAGGTIRARRMH